MTKEYEALIKKEYAKVYKERYGKGPNHVRIRITENIIIIITEGALCQLELSLLQFEIGEELVKRIRDEIVKTGTIYKPIVENAVGLKVAGSSYYLDKNKDTLYVFVVMEGSITKDRTSTEEKS